MLKEQKGITLIALVITVIVLLILAGVAMSMLTAEDGTSIFQQAGTAGNSYNAASLNEKNDFDNLMNYLNNMNAGTSTGA